MKRWKPIGWVALLLTAVIVLIPRQIRSAEHQPPSSTEARTGAPEPKPSLPDLAIGDVQFDERHPYDLKVRLLNLDSAEEGFGPTEVIVDISGPGIETTRVGSLDLFFRKGEREKWVSMTSEDHRVDSGVLLQFIVDPDHNVRESNETNNALEIDKRR